MDHRLNLIKILLERAKARTEVSRNNSYSTKLNNMRGKLLAYAVGHYTDSPEGVNFHTTDNEPDVVLGDDSAIEVKSVTAGSRAPKGVHYNSPTHHALLSGVDPSKLKRGRTYKGEDLKEIGLDPRTVEQLSFNKRGNAIRIRTHERDKSHIEDIIGKRDFHVIGGFERVFVAEPDAKTAKGLRDLETSFYATDASRGRTAAKRYREYTSGGPSTSIGISFGSKYEKETPENHKARIQQAEQRAKNNAGKMWKRGSFDHAMATVEQETLRIIQARRDEGDHDVADDYQEALKTLRSEHKAARPKPKRKTKAKKRK
jgi:hypothetical protein